jgi:fumarate reductase subunit D
MRRSDEPSYWCLFGTGLSLRNVGHDLSIMI